MSMNKINISPCSNRAFIMEGWGREYSCAYRTKVPVFFSTVNRVLLSASRGPPEFLAIWSSHTIQQLTLRSAGKSHSDLSLNSRTTCKCLAWLNQAHEDNLLLINTIDWGDLNYISRIPLLLPNVGTLLQEILLCSSKVTYSVMWAILFYLEANVRFYHKPRERILQGHGSLDGHFEFCLWQKPLQNSCWERMVWTKVVTIRMVNSGWEGKIYCQAQLVK